jgi:hypothetical protein
MARLARVVVPGRLMGLCLKSRISPLAVPEISLPIVLSLKGSPIKRSSLKENASPGEETTIVALLRYGRVAYSLRQPISTGNSVDAGPLPDARRHRLPFSFATIF